MSMNWNGYGKNLLLPNLRQHSGICLEGLEGVGWILLAQDWE